MLVDAVLKKLKAKMEIYIVSYVFYAVLFEAISNKNLARRKYICLKYLKQSPFRRF